MTINHQGSQNIHGIHHHSQHHQNHQQNPHHQPQMSQGMNHTQGIHHHHGHGQKKTQKRRRHHCQEKTNHGIHQRNPQMSPHCHQRRSQSGKLSTILPCSSREVIAGSVSPVLGAACCSSSCWILALRSAMVSVCPRSDSNACAACGCCCCCVADVFGVVRLTVPAAGTWAEADEVTSRARVMAVPTVTVVIQRGCVITFIVIRPNFISKQTYAPLLIGVIYVVLLYWNV